MFSNCTLLLFISMSCTNFDLIGLFSKDCSLLLRQNLTVPSLPTSTSAQVDSKRERMVPPTWWDLKVAHVNQFCYFYQVGNIKHELMHALGFSVQLYGFFRNGRGEPRTARNAAGRPPLHSKYGASTHAAFLVGLCYHLWLITFQGISCTWLAQTQWGGWWGRAGKLLAVRWVAFQDLGGR